MRGRVGGGTAVAKTRYCAELLCARLRGRGKACVRAILPRTPRLSLRASAQKQTSRRRRRRRRAWHRGYRADDVLLHFHRTSPCLVPLHSTPPPSPPPSAPFIRRTAPLREGGREGGHAIRPPRQSLILRPSAPVHSTSTSPPRRPASPPCTLRLSSAPLHCPTARRPAPPSFPLPPPPASFPSTPRLPPARPSIYLRPVPPHHD